MMAIKPKACPVCGWINGPGHAPWCTPALRSLVQAAEEWVAGHGRGNTTIEDLVLGVPGIRLVEAVRRFRAARRRNK